MFCIGFCTLLEGKWLNMNGRLLCLGKKLHREIKHTFYVQYAITAFEITKEQGANAEKCLAIPNFRNLVSFVLIQNMK